MPDPIWRKRAWVEHAKRESFPQHDDISEGGADRNYWQQTFYAGWDACQRQIDMEAITQ